MKQAAIDLGTQTCSVLIAHIHSSTRNVQQVLYQDVFTTQLGESVERKNEFIPEAMDRTMTCLKKIKEILLWYEITPENTLCVATGNARKANNALDFFKKINQTLGLSFVIISGEQEAFFTYCGVIPPDRYKKNYVVLDIGGGSTEWISRGYLKSLDMGSLNLTERFFYDLQQPVSDESFWACQELIDFTFNQLFSSLPEAPNCWIAVAGVPTILAMYILGITHFDEKKINTFSLSRSMIHRVVEELKWRTIPERADFLSLPLSRARTILAGCLILWRALEKGQQETCLVSTYGLRWGVLSLGEKLIQSHNQ